MVARRLFPNPEQEQLRHVLYEQVIQADLRGCRAAMRALARFDVRGRLKEIKVPTLVITGELDSTPEPGEFPSRKPLITPYLEMDGSILT